MSLFARLFGDRKERQQLLDLYRAVVATGRAPFWYREGQVPDTVDGRFYMIAAVTALVLLRMEQEQDRLARESVLLTELFIDDMDRSLREIGINDVVVGKHIGKMMGALGGRLAAFREAVEDDRGFAGAVRRNIFVEAPPSPQAEQAVAARLETFWKSLVGIPPADLLQGRLPSI